MSSGSWELCDVTLRDGEQAPDVAFTLPEKLQVIASLDQVGVSRVQVGSAFGDGVETVRNAKREGASVPLEILSVGFTPDWKRQIEAVVDSNADSLQIVMRTNPEVLRHTGLSRTQALKRCQYAAAYARSCGISEVTVALSFATQTPENFMLSMCAAANDGGATRILLCDTTGVGYPDTITSLVSSVIAQVSIPIGVHCHNDFGLATANTISGLTAGASFAEVSVNGIGERGGNASLTEVAMALKVLYQSECGIKTERLTALAHQIAGITRQSLPSNEPLVGYNAFSQQLDIHVALASKIPEILEPCSPVMVGNRRRTVLGKGSGAIAVGQKLTEAGLAATPDEINALVSWVQAEAERNKRAISDFEFEMAARAALARFDASR